MHPTNAILYFLCFILLEYIKNNTTMPAIGMKTYVGRLSAVSMPHKILQKQNVIFEGICCQIVDLSASPSIS